MDFPKSVPGIGLVNGRFIDENPVTGQQGSLIAAAWGNQATDELLNILGEAKKVADNPDDFDPSEEKSNQVVEAIKVLITNSIPTSLSDWKDINNKPTAITALTNIITVNTTTTLTNTQLGIILIDASASDVALTLPQANNTNLATKVTLFRLDNSTNKVTIKCTTGEAIYFDTKWNANGYGFFYLMGAGDYWQITSDGNKGWFKFACYDNTPLGRVVFDTSINISAGGWILGSGTLLSRSEYPWAWDYAQQSGMLVDDSSHNGFEGCWTNGDGVTTFRTPDLRGEFLRALDNGRGIDANRIAGSYQKGTFYGFDTLPSTGNAGNATKAPLTEDQKKLMGVDVGNADDFGSNVGMYWNNAQGSSWLPTTSDSDWGTTRPRNISYPVYIKII